LTDLSGVSQLSLYALLALLGGLNTLLVFWQIAVLSGRSMQNVDGSFDDWRRQHTHFGIALADVLIACPLGFAAIALVFVEPAYGHWLLAMYAFYHVWANTVTTATSLKFYAPKITLAWFIVFPFGALVGLAYLVWAALHFTLLWDA